MTLIELYFSQNADGSAGENSRALLKQAHWFAVNAEFDSKTGEALPQALTAFLARLTQTNTYTVKHDRLWRITEHARPSIERLFRTLNESPRREQALLPVHAVRELDANSFIKLSNRPGRNIREKLAGKPYLQAVRRFQSVNLPENRLLKAFVTRLAELMELRRDCLGEEEDDLLSRIHSWLRSDDAQAIARWDNLPPNNALLSHRDYRRVWDSWRWLQSLDDDIAHDFSQLAAREETMQKWIEYGQMYGEGSHFFAEMPILFSYDDFVVRPWVPHRAVRDSERKISRSQKPKEVFEPACIDLTSMHPRYSISYGSSLALRDTYLWQQWNSNKEAVDMELFHSDAAYLHADATSVASTDLFFSNENISDNLLDRAARLFTGRLRETFKNDGITWLTPDFIDDFELEILRRNINARFPGAVPLPRSVAAVFEQVDHSKINRDDLPVVVVDYIGGKTCVIKLIARFDRELKQRLPETRGFYWERCPPVIISHSDQGGTHQEQQCGYDLITLDCKGHWHDPIPKKHNQHIAHETLKRDPRIGQFELCIDLKKSPVAGGARLQSLQSQACDIPLWRDQIPELSIKVMRSLNGVRFHKNFPLVSRGTFVKPIRGLSVPIPVADHFHLPARQQNYEFRLFQGENSTEIGFSARLESPKFPLDSETKCQLHLSFTYGADEPYKLVFAPLDQSFPHARATWKRTEEKIITNAPAPDYPQPLSWKDLHIFPDAKNGGRIDLLNKAIETEANLVRWLDRGDEKSWNNIRKSIKRWCRFLFISIWRDGRSISDSDCPKDFSKSLRHLNTVLDKAADQDSALDLDVRFLKAYMHKDTSADCIEWLYEQLKGGIIRDHQAIGFALGDVSEDWQKDMFGILASKPKVASVSVFAYAIWREQHFVQKFSITEVRSLLKVLSNCLTNVRPLKLKGNQRKDEWTIRAWVRSTAEPLELLLGLLRTRSSMEPKIKMLLQPHQKITKQLAEQVEWVAEIVAKSNVGLFSRVQITVPTKPEGDQTPDLLYALRLYLTGNDGAKVIRITSVSDSDD